MNADVLNDFAGSSSDALSVRTSPATGSYYISSIAPRFKNLEIIASNYRLHKSMIESSMDVHFSPSPIAYVAFSSATNAPSVNESSSSGMLQAARRSYEKIEQRLLKLSAHKTHQAEIDPGAVKSALEVVKSLSMHRYAPPEVTKQSDDAIVMLWALGDSTCAITVTDGEVGYVVRRNRKAIRIADSIAIGAFRLEDLR